MKCKALRSVEIIVIQLTTKLGFLRDPFWEIHLKREITGTAVPEHKADMARGIVKSVIKDTSPKQETGKSETDGKPTPINLGDQAGLKRGLDDCAVSVRLICR